MTRQTIAVDIDDVLASSAQEWISYSNQHWGTNLTIENYHEDWATMWQVDRLTESKRAREIYDAQIVLDFKNMPDARDVLLNLSEKYDLKIATSRVSMVHKDTVEWLDRYFGGIFKEIHHSGIFDTLTTGPLKDEGMHKVTKADLCREIGADFLIDDQPKHCLAVADAGLETILFGEYSWNKDIGELPERVTRCKNWAAVSEFFNERG